MEGKCLVFQKSIEQNNSIIEMLEHFRKDLCEKLQDSTENAKNKNRKILELMEKNNKLQMELHGQKLEKENLETTARKINEKFVEMRNIQEKLIASLNDKDTVISDLHSEKDKLSEENRRCRSLEFEYKRKIVELQKNLENMDIEKQDLAAVHYDELCEYSRKMKAVEGRMEELENDLMDKISAVSKLEVLLMQKEQLTLELSERSTKSECLLKEAMSKIESLEKEIRNLISNLNKNLLEINKLKEEKYQLQHCLNQREKLLGKVFQAFKMKIQEAVNEANNKFFLQRLCSDLKSALKIYMEQNKILRENFQNRSVELGDQYIKKSGKYNEKYIRALLEQQEDFSNVRESFGDVQVFLDSIKKELCCVQEKLVGLV
ncbi:hypothetical protein HHI36_020729 [Cryptolaemus montrouzieri]|uniref:Uncharacterized protein n=1 Tax=Cryptolaemus montrouzieri TaxID=559131 RepID=A0ABD2NB63_9CUCU